MTPLRWAVLLALGLSTLFALWRPSDGGGVMTGFEGRMLDARFLVRGPLPAPDSVAILAIDDASLSALDAFPPPRSALGQAVEAARSAGAAAVAFDLLLAGQGQGDAALQDALAAGPPSILAISFLGERNSDLPVLDGALARSALPLVVGAPQGQALEGLAPLRAFADLSWLAHVNVQPEADGALRRIPAVLQARPGVVLPVLPLQAVRLANDMQISVRWGERLEIGAHQFALDRNNEMAVNFYGPSKTIQTTSLVRAGEADLAGRVVFIGASAVGYGDRFATPFSRDMPGVEVLATLAANLSDGNGLRRDDMTWGLDVLLALVVAGIGVMLASRRTPSVAFLTTGALWIGALGGLYIGFLQGLWLDGTTLVVALLTASLCGGAARLMMQRQAAMNLGSYQSPLLKEVLSQSARPAFDGREQDAAVLFVDVEGYTSRSEALGHAATTHFLRQFHQVVETAATAHSGIVEQYAGDGAMICFGLPEPSDADAAHALACSEALFSGVAKMNRRLQDENQPPAAIRISAHFGRVSAAVLGGAQQGHVTFVGDVVNVTSRLQDVAKSLNVRFVVSGDLIAAAGNVELYGLTQVGPVALRGRSEPIMVWSRDPIPVKPKGVP